MTSPRLKKALGQHHLTDGRLCAPAVRFLGLGAGDWVVEIGPGGGILTAELAATGARVWAWEVDLEWAAALAQRWPRLSDAPCPALVVADALTLPWERLPPGTKVTGNLPYNISTVLIADLLTRGLGVERAAFLVQKEVGDRLTARPGEPDYGALSVLVAARATVSPLATVKAGSFRPPPKVDGAFVGFVRRAPPLPESQMPHFLATVRAAFAQRRKTLRNTLGAAWGREAATAALEAAGIPPETRAERLGVAEFVALVKAGGG